MLFVFAVVFTLFMLEGKAGIICAAAYRFPQLVTPFPNEKNCSDSFIAQSAELQSKFAAAGFNETVRKVGDVRLPIQLYNDMFLVIL